jgi:Tfp pilus assembly ATPase PilU
MVSTRVIQDCIRNADRTYELSEFIGKGKHYGMQTFDQALMRMLNKKLITKETAMAAASSPADLLLQMSLGITEEEEMSIERHNYSEMPEVMDLEMDALDELPEPSSSEPDPEPESD